MPGWDYKNKRAYSIMAIMSDLHSEDRVSTTRRSTKNASIAQLAEQHVCTMKVVGSMPT